MSSKDLVRKFVAALLLCAFIAGAFSSAVAKRPQTTPRKIVSDDFTKNRASRSDPNNKPSQVQASDKQSKPRVSRTYRFASSKSDKPATRSHRTVTAQLGITIWRLRPMKANDKGATVVVKENDKLSEWVAERVESDTVFNKGDFVRLSIESPRAGYLYVVNQDQFDDDTTGNPAVIYPWGGMAPGDNRVQPGMIVDIPSHEDDPSYFRASPTKANQVGELLTFIVTKTPLDLPISKDPLKISKVQLTSWKKQWGSNSERFEMEGGAGELWTEKEKQAASRTRTRQLTRTDPAPQTIIRVTGANTSGLLVNVRLAYAK
jgi:Domain of unknown function (DUF4384)